MSPKLVLNLKLLSKAWLGKGWCCDSHQNLAFHRPCPFRCRLCRLTEHLSICQLRGSKGSPRIWMKRLETFMSHDFYMIFVGPSPCTAGRTLSHFSGKTCFWRQSLLWGKAKRTTYFHLFQQEVNACSRKWILPCVSKNCLNQLFHWNGVARSLGGWLLSTCMAPLLKTWELVLFRFCNRFRIIITKNDHDSYHHWIVIFVYYHC